MNDVAVFLSVGTLSTLLGLAATYRPTPREGFEGRIWCPECKRVSYAYEHRGRVICLSCPEVRGRWPWRR